MPNPILVALETAVQSPSVQTVLVNAITAGEVELKTVGDNVIENAKGSGILGVVINAGKGAVEAEFNAELAKLSPLEVAIYLQGLAVNELKALGG